jgi:hypothetical protein
LNYTAVTITAIKGNNALEEFYAVERKDIYGVDGLTEFKERDSYRVLRVAGLKLLQDSFNRSRNNACMLL